MSYASFIGLDFQLECSGEELRYCLPAVPVLSTVAMHSKGSAETPAGIPLQKMLSLIQLFLLSLHI